MTKRNIRLKVSYDGTKYQGWQRLKKSNNTIQGKIEEVLSKMLESNVEIIASGRTDAGVHAENQICNFYTDSNKTVDNIRNYLNKFLPEDIVVKEVDEVNRRFHSRYNVKDKTYLYRIWTGDYPPLFERKYVYNMNKLLDINKMKKVAKLLIGEHDFQGFCSRKTKKSTIRDIKNINIQQHDNEIRIFITANGFLYNMVRIIVGTLIDISLNRLEEDIINIVLDNKDRSKAGEKAPAQGLILYEVNY